MELMNEKIRVRDRVTIYPRGKKGIYCADFWHQGKHRRSSLKTRNRKVAEVSWLSVKWNVERSELAGYRS
jgi:hypothetical protein